MTQPQTDNRSNGRDLLAAACPGCGSESQQAELTGEDPLSGDPFNVVRCQACGLAYVNPRPLGDHLASYYPDDYYGARHPFFKKLLMGLRARKLGPPPSEGRLLDIGCGRGDFLLECRRRGWQVTGIEQAHSPIMRLRNSLGLEVVPPEEISTLPDASFDVVTLWHVLEHMPQPGDILKEVCRLIKPGGRLLVEVPNFGSWQARFGRSAWHHLDLPRHLLHFDRRSLAKFLSASEITPERWQTFSLEYDTFGLAQTMLNLICRQPNHFFQLLIKRPTEGGRLDTLLSLALLPLFGLIAAAVSFIAPLAGQGGVLRVIARKRLPA